MKNIIESVLVKHLAKYIDGLKNSLDIAILDGQATIENVKLNASFVNELGLPFALKFSHIEKVHVDIPWTNLKTKNTVITVRGLYVLFNMNKDDTKEEFDPGMILKGMIERIKLLKKERKDNGSKDDTFAEKKIIRIADNAILNISNVHFRLQSTKEGRNFSLGFIMDDLSAYTVDEEKQRYFYCRNFIEKEHNEPFHKLISIPTLKVYLNDDENVFVCDKLNSSRAYILKMMTYPFVDKEPSSPSKKKGKEEVAPTPHYDMSNLAVLSFQAMASQTCSEDRRYDVIVSAHILKIDLTVSDGQLSKLMFVSQHCYEFYLNSYKKRQKTMAFDHSNQNQFQNMVQKMINGQLTVSDEQQMKKIIKEVPISILDNIIDVAINKVRVDVAINKITRAGSPPKSRQVVDELLLSREKFQLMDGGYLFSNISIKITVDRITLYLLKNQQIFAELGLLANHIDCFIDSHGLVSFTCKFMKFVILHQRKQISQDLYDLALPWIYVHFQLQKKEITHLSMTMQKKQLTFNEDFMSDFIDWVSLVRVSPSMLNYVDEQMNYSTDQMNKKMDVLIRRGRKIAFSLAMPVITLHLDQKNTLRLNFGSFSFQTSVDDSNMTISWRQGLKIESNATTILQIYNENSIIVIKKDHETPFEDISIQISKIKVQNIKEVVSLLSSIRKDHYATITKYLSLNLADCQFQEQLKGIFYLNSIKSPLKGKIARTHLCFTPAESGEGLEQRISLPRTKMYRLVSQERYFIVFKEEVDRVVDVLEVESESALEKVFTKVGDYIQQMRTSFQWHQFHEKPYQSAIDSLDAIQDINSPNSSLLRVNINIQKVEVQFSPNSFLQLQSIDAEIRFSQLNVEANVQVRKVGLKVGGQQIICDASFRGRCQSWQPMVIDIQVVKLAFRVDLHSTLSNMIQVASEYYTLLHELKKSRIEEVGQIDEGKLIVAKNQHQNKDNLNTFLLACKITIEAQDISGDLIGYRSKVSSLKLEIQRDRNESRHRISAQSRGLLAMSMLQIPLMTLKYGPHRFQLNVDSLSAEVHLHLLIFQVLRGEGKLVLKEIIRANRNIEIARMQNTNDYRNQNGRVSLKISIDFFRVGLNLSSNICLGIISKEVQISQAKLSWRDLRFELNKDCISTSPSSGILRWNQTSLNLNSTSIKLKLNSREVTLLCYEVNKTYLFLSNSDFLKFVQEEIEKPDPRPLSRLSRSIRAGIEEVELVYESTDRNPLFSIILKSVVLANHDQVNSVNLQIWHLNRNLKVYEPLLEPLQLKIVLKQSHLVDFFAGNVSLVVTEEMVGDFMQGYNQLRQIREGIEDNELQQLNQEQADRVKRSIGLKKIAQYVEVEMDQNACDQVMIRLRNHLSCRIIVQIGCGSSFKQQLLFDREQLGSEQTKQIKVPQKTSYLHSYELIERYQKVTLRICILNSHYSAKTVSVSFFLNDVDNSYVCPLVIVDPEGQEHCTQLSVNVRYAEGAYLLSIMPRYSIRNEIALPLHFSFRDHASTNRFTLTRNETVHFPIWVVESVNFGLTPADLSYILELNSEGASQKPGKFELSMRRDENSQFEMIILKEIAEKYKDSQFGPKNRALNQGDILTSNQQHEQASVEANLKLFRFRIVSALLVRNHLLFPIYINEAAFQYGEEAPLLHIHEDTGRKMIRVGLGDGSVHQILLGGLNNADKVTLKVKGQNYVDFWLFLRKNHLGQVILHIYTQVHLILNLQDLIQPTLKTHIYGHTFIVKKQLCNNFTDLFHPAPVLRDKFVFNTLHYLLSKDQKYISVQLGANRSNQIVLYHSDFDTDLTFLDERGREQEILAVSYRTALIELEQEREGSERQFLECNFTYIMPKFYLINRSETVLVLEGSSVLGQGEKVTLNCNEDLTLQVRDRADFAYLFSPLNQTNHLMFIRNVQPKRQERKEKADICASLCRGGKLLEETQQTRERTSRESNERPEQPLLNRNEEGINSSHKEEELDQADQCEKDPFVNLKHKILMDDVVLLSLSSRKCEHNTICYQVNDWHQWLTINNSLASPVAVRVKIMEGVVGEQIIGKGTCGKIISGLSDLLQITLIEDGQIVLGYFDLRQRLNQSILLPNCQNRQICLKESKMKVGRCVLIQNVPRNKETTLHKVTTSANLNFGRVVVSVILYEESIRRELVRLTLTNLQLVFIRYLNGLYMCHIQVDVMHGIYKQLLFLLSNGLVADLQGFREEFIDRLSFSLGNELRVILTDEIIASFLVQFQKCRAFFPSREEVFRVQAEQTFHINSLKVQPLEIKLSLRKINSQRNDHRSRLFEKVSLSMMEIEETTVSLSAVDIEEPLRKKHFDRTVRMWLMEVVIGIASGLNIFGGPNQLLRQLREGSQRGPLQVFRALLAGVTYSLSKIMGTIGSGLSELTFDEDLVRERIKHKNIKAESFEMGVKMGLRELGSSLKSTITGLVEQPLEGHRRGGRVGAIKGTLFGLTGLVTKPISGIILAVAKTVEGLSASSSYLDYHRWLGRQLLSRPLYHKFQMVRPFSKEDETAYNILIGEQSSEKVELIESYMLECEDGSQSSELLVVTCEQLMVIDLSGNETLLRLGLQELIATGIFLQGVVIYMRAESDPAEQQQMVFRLSQQPLKNNLYLTLKALISLYRST